MSDLPLPYGWIQEMDQTHGHPYWVDTKANPPRSIWTHPYEDEQYLNENPAVREKVQNKRHSHPDLPGLAPGDSNSGDPRRHSFSGSQSGIQAGTSGAASSSTANDRNAAGKKGFFGKLKDKAIGTKEEREAYKKQQMEIDRQRALQRQQQMAAYQAQVAQMRQQRQQQGRPFGGGMYSSPAGNPYQMGGGFGGGMNGRRRQGGGFGGGGIGLPLIGGLAGGLLLGDMMGDGFGDGGDGGGWGGDGGGDGGGFGGDGGGGDFGGGGDGGGGF